MRPLSFYGSMNQLHAEPSQLFPLHISIRVGAIDPAEPSSLGSEYLYISAKLTHWSDSIVQGLLANKGATAASATMEALEQASLSMLFDFMGNMHSQGILRSIGPHQWGATQSGPQGTLIAKIRLEAQATWDAIEAFESPCIDRLARMFDGQASITIESVRGFHSESLALSTGNIATEAPTFGSNEPIPMAISAPSGSPAAKVHFHPGSASLLEVLTAGPAELRSTPGGRRDLAMLFLENEIEESLAAIDKPGLAYEIVDSTNTADRSLTVVIHDESDTLAAKALVSMLKGRWPDIFS